MSKPLFIHDHSGINMSPGPNFEIFFKATGDDTEELFDYFDLRGVRAPSKPSCAATGLTRPREPAPGQEGDLAGMPLLPVGPRSGEVDDDNAFACGGVAGHAGLFGGLPPSGALAGDTSGEGRGMVWHMAKP